MLGGERGGDGRLGYIGLSLSSSLPCLGCNGRGPALAPSKLGRCLAIGPMAKPRLRPTHATRSRSPPPLLGFLYFSATSSMYPAVRRPNCCALNFKLPSIAKRNKTRTIQLESWSSDVSASFCYQAHPYPRRRLLVSSPR